MDAKLVSVLAIVCQGSSYCRLKKGFCNPQRAPSHGFPISQIDSKPFNYYEWKSRVEMLLRMKGFHWIRMGTEVEPNSTIEKYKYLNKMVEASWLLYYSISPNLLYHIEANKTPNELWTTLSTFFRTGD